MSFSQRHPLLFLFMQASITALIGCLLSTFIAPTEFGWPKWLSLPWKESLPAILKGLWHFVPYVCLLGFPVFVVAAVTAFCVARFYPTRTYVAACSYLWVTLFFCLLAYVLLALYNGWPNLFEETTQLREVASWNLFLSWTWVVAAMIQGLGLFFIFERRLRKNSTENPNSSSQVA